MKIRGFFVSNSSSSSFIVAVKAGTTFTTDSIMETFRVPKDSPVYNLNRSIAEFMAERASKMDIEYLLNDYGYKTIEEAIEDGSLKNEMDYINRGYDVYRFSASNEDGGIEQMLCDTYFDIRTDDMVIIGGGGY